MSEGEKIRRPRGDHGRQLRLGVVLSYLTTGCQLVIGLLYTPLMIHLLGQSEYGLYSLVGSVVSYLSLFSLGFNGAYLRFYSRYREAGDEGGVARLNGMFLLLFLALALAALVTGLTLAQFTRQVFGTNLTPAELARAKVLMQILVVNLALTFPASVFDSIISSREQFVFQRGVALLSVVCNPLVCLPLLIMGYGSVAMVVVTTAITTGKLLVDVWYVLRRLRVPFAFSGLDGGLLREMGSFSFFIFLNMIIDQLNLSVDKLILGRVSGTAAVAVYGVGSTIHGMYLNFSTQISSVFAPRVNRIAARHDQNMSHDFTELFIKVGRIQFIVIMLIMTGFVFFGYRFIVDFYAGAGYGDAYPVALLLMGTASIPLIQNIGIEIQRSVNRHQFRSLVYLGTSIANVAASIPLARLYGPVGSAIGTAVTQLVGPGLIINVFYHRALGIDVPRFWKNIGRLALGLLAPAALGVGIMSRVSYSGLASMACWIVLYAGVYLVSMWFVGMNNYERGLFLRPVRGLLARRGGRHGTR